MERFTEVINLTRYALYVFDYGAPVGFRLAVHHPERVTALISQNGNAYEEGLSDGWNPIQAYWKDPSPENRSALRAFLTPETTQWQYTHGAPDPERLSPDAWTLDSALLAGPAMTRSNSIYSATIRAMSRARRAEMRESLTALADTWTRLAAEHESDEALLRAISELEFSEPYEALPQALKLHSWPTSVTIATSRQSLDPSR